MINLNFGLWWSGGKLSYLRYLTFKSLRHFHPDSKIQLYVGEKFDTKHKWNVEKQDFENDKIDRNYLQDLYDLNIEIIHVDFFWEYAPNYQSDLFRWWFLYTFGGWYLDTDQIILKSFDTLTKEYDFIYSGYKAITCGYYTPVGVIGSSQHNELVQYIMKKLPNIIDTNNYNSAGPFMLRMILQSVEWDGKMFNAPSNYFYPASESIYVGKIFDGSLDIGDESYALHWYGGHPESQKFNLSYNEDVSAKSMDKISVLLRERNIV